MMGGWGHRGDCLPYDFPIGPKIFFGKFWGLILKTDFRFRGKILEPL